MAAVIDTPALLRHIGSDSGPEPAAEAREILTPPGI